MTKATENAKQIGKGLFRLAAWWGTGTIVTCAVKAVIPKHKMNIVQNACVIAATFVITDIVADAVIKHSDKTIDQFWDDINPKKWKAIFEGEDQNGDSV